MAKGQKIVLPACRGHLPIAPPPSSAPPRFPTACRRRRNPTSHIEKWWRAGCEAASPHHFCRLPQKQDAQVHLLYAFQYIYFPMLDPGGASSCWLELGCKRVDGSMPHKHWCSTFFLLCVLICFLLIFSLRDTEKSLKHVVPGVHTICYPRMYVYSFSLQMC
uniref:Uncharacterized protein n=1 Tax=Triticum urartu TaxID=4572 RepID=A0A8R7QWT5_TRIUA